MGVHSRGSRIPSLLGVSQKSYFVYVLASRSQALYVGITSDLSRRLAQHRRGEGSEFAERYRVTRLVYVETYGFVGDALRREKQLKGWTRAKRSG